MTRTASFAERQHLSPRAEPFRLRDRPPYVTGYAWRNPNATACLVLLHGLQSHAGWFAEAGEELCERGLSVYALDRRGTGTSPGVRGDIRDYQAWFAEVGTVVDQAQSEHPSVPVHLAGHCFGSNIGLGYALTQPERVRSLIMLTPGLFVRPGYTLTEKLRIGAGIVARPTTRLRVPQDDDMFTRDPEVLAWINADTLGSRTITARCLMQINNMLRRLRRDVDQLAVPVLLLEASHDRISHNERNRELLERALAGRLRRVTFDAEHFLLAEPCRDQVVDEIVRWVNAGIEELGKSGVRSSKSAVARE